MSEVGLSNSLLALRNEQITSKDDQWVVGNYLTHNDDTLKKLSW